MNTDPAAVQPRWLTPQHPREGRYVLGPLLGKGGMGEVVEAWDVVLCRTVALKILRNMDPPAMIRFMHEAQLQARLAHPNICRIYDVDHGEGTLRIAMHLVRGPSLEQAAQELTPVQLADILGRVAEAAHAAHSIKLIHRDIKPSNVLLEPDGRGGWSPCLCDFGLAMSMGEPALTFSHAVVGTPAYMAPEQVNGQRDRIGPATDIYALGGTLHFALTGQPPTQGDRTTFGARRGRRLRGDLARVVRKCLEEDPALRYPSALALAEDLYRVREGQPIEARSTGPLARLGRRLRRSRVNVIGIPMAVGLCLGTWALSAYFDRLDRRAQFDSARRLAWAAGVLARDLQLAQTLPARDLRPELGRIRAQMHWIRNLRGAAAHAPAPLQRLSLARGHYLLGEYGPALEELRAAEALGFRGPEMDTLAGLATLCARALAGDPRPYPAPKPYEPWDPQQDHLIEALGALRQGNPLRAADQAASDAEAQPWLEEPALVRSLALLQAGRRARAACDLFGAERHFAAAEAAAARFLEHAPGSIKLHQARLWAAAEGAQSTLARGQVPDPNALDRFGEGQGPRLLDPGDADLRDAWDSLLAIRAEAACSAGRDPLPLLAGIEAPRSAPASPRRQAILQRVQLVLAWRALDRGANPEAHLGPALATPDSGLFLGRLPQAEALLMQARALAGRGQDPRPTLASLAQVLEHWRGHWPAWSEALAAAEGAWLGAAWAAANGQDPRPGLVLAEQALDRLQAGPGDGAAPALRGLVALQWAALEPGRADLHRQVARNHLGTALAQGGRSHLATDLRARLGGAR